MQVVFDADDFAFDHESNGLNWLFELKYKYPNFRVTLFTILNKWRIDMLRDISKIPWIELAAHGYSHDRNSESCEWEKKDWYKVINEYEQTGIFTKIFKAPNWEMSLLGYYVLKELGWAVAVRKSQIVDLPQGMKYYCFEDNFFGVHGHTWTLEAHCREGMFSHWVKETNFDFVSSQLETK